MKHVRPSIWSAVVIAGFVIAAASPLAQNGNTTTATASAMLEAAIQKHLVAGDLAGAISQYEAILAKYGSQRRIASQALLRLAQAQEQLGKLEDAFLSYDRLVRSYSDDPSLLRVAQNRLTELKERVGWEDIDTSRDIVAMELMSRPTTGTASGQYQDEYRTPGARNIAFTDISVFDRQTGLTRRLTDGQRPAAFPLTSPNGQLVAYLSWNGDLKEAVARREVGYGDPRVAAELRVVGIAGGNDRVLARPSGVQWLRPFSWSADNQSLLALFERSNGMRQIALISVDTLNVRILEEGPWLPVQTMAISSDKNYVAYQVPTSRISPQFEFKVLPLNVASPRDNDWRYAISLTGQRGARVTEDELAIHVLNRIGFGPRKGDIERFKKIGFEAYVEQQLRPEKIADPFVDAIVGQFTSLKMEIPELLAATAPPAMIAERRRSSIFQRQNVVERIQAEAKAQGGSVNARAVSDPLLLSDPKRPLDMESHMARMIRAVHSEKQLQEQLVDFWMNHFNVNLDDDRLVPSFEEQAIRANVLGKFENMLVAVSRHPKMLYYLDNWRSSAPAEVLKQRIEEARKSGGTDAHLTALEREPFLKDSKGINENFARELLELHTMGVDSGYTQQDIINVARILTGWTVGTKGIWSAQEEDGVFWFDPLMHVEGDKVVLGQTFKSGGVDEGMQLLKMLAKRPETAKYISMKLARRFIADTPPQAVIDQAAQTFLKTDGDLREVVRTILLSPQFRSSEAIRSKIKKPFELVASSLRAVDASFEDLAAYSRLITGNPNVNIIARMGERMYTHEAPDGNPDVGPAYINSNALLVRFEFANSLAMGRVAGVKPNLVSAEALLTQLGIAKPTAQQIEQTRAMMLAEQQKNLPPGMAGGSSQMMMTGGPDDAALKPKPIEPAALVVATMMMSPQFQKR